VPTIDPFRTDNSYYVGMVVDADGNVAEANEGNNRNRGDGMDRHPVLYALEFADFSAVGANLLPSGWSRTDGSNDGNTWTLDNPMVRESANWANGFMLVDSDYAGPVSMDESLITRSIDCTGRNNVNLSFTHDFVRYGSETAAVEYRVNNGTWTNLASYTTTTSGTVNLALPSAVNSQPNVQVRWRYYNANYDMYWGVDNVKITAGSTDSTAPTASITAVSPDPRSTSVSAITIVFSEQVANLNLADLSLTRDGGANLLTSGQTLTTSDFVTYTLGNLAGITGASGTYTLTLTAAGSGIWDVNGNALAANATEVWTLAAGPDINVQGNSQDILDGDTTPTTADHTDFGNADVAGGTVTRTFTIQNTGNEVLTLDADPVTITGTHAADFQLLAQPATLSLGPGASTTFQVRFDPSASGLRSATVNIASNDADEDPYDFAIQGGAGDQRAGRRAEHPGRRHQPEDRRQHRFRHDLRDRRHGHAHLHHPEHGDRGADAHRGHARDAHRHPRR